MAEAEQEGKELAVNVICHMGKKILSARGVSQL